MNESYTFETIKITNHAVKLKEKWDNQFSKMFDEKMAQIQVYQIAW